MNNGKIRSSPHTITIPPLKTCTTGARSKSFWVPFIEDDTATGVLRERAICDSMSGIIAEGTEVVQAIMGGVAEAMAKKTVVVSAMVLGVSRGMLMAVGTLILMQPASKPAGESAWLRGESDKSGKELRLAQVTTGHIGITSGSSCKLGRYPSELNWSSLGDVLGFIYGTEGRIDQAMLWVAANGK